MAPLRGRESHAVEKKRNRVLLLSILIPET